MTQTALPDGDRLGDSSKFRLGSAATDSGGGAWAVTLPSA